MKYFFAPFVFAVFFTSQITAQFSEDFSDGDFNGWIGDMEHFAINPQLQLQLNAPSGSTRSFLHHPLVFRDSMIWEIYFKLDFAPSTTNQMRIYLGLTSPDINIESGYFLEIGASGNMDALELKYLDQGIPQIIDSSVPGLVANEPVEMKIRVVKSSDGVWHVYSVKDITELLFSAHHDLLPLTTLNTFGLYATYSDTRRDKFYFDNISIQLKLSDTIPPLWEDLHVVDSNTLSLIFNETIEPLGGSENSNFILHPGNELPEHVVLDKNQIELTWNQSFESQETYSLRITGLTDLNGNLVLEESRDFTYIDIDTASPNELLITEIMADPNPAIGLPDAEFIEIWNNSGKVFDLSQYNLQIGTNERVLPTALIQAGEYIILAAEGDQSLYSPFGRVVVIDNFPALTNSGTSLSISGRDGQVIHELKYNLDWYQDDAKSGGGWSLELIRPSHLCGDDKNWAASRDLKGGTPGMVNSQWDLSEDDTGPILASIYTGNTGHIELRFNEKLDGELMINPLLYHFKPSMEITTVEIIESTILQLQLTQPLDSGIMYKMLPLEAFDCVANSMKTDTVYFGLATVPKPGEILINEILFNPSSGGSRFLEVINVSKKYLDLGHVAIARIDENHSDVYATGLQEMLGPGQIAAFSPDPADIFSRYYVSNPDMLYEASLPSWDDENDPVVLLAGGLVIDSLTYSSSWHHPVIDDQNGVSLERIDDDGNSTSPSSWHSASSLSGYGTPTGANSQKVQSSTLEKPFSIDNRRFSPNDDGFNDFLFLRIEPESGIDVGSVWVYDLEGREVFQILTNEIIGTSSLLQWDGRNADGILADMGIYLIFVQLWDTDGKIQEFQETCALIKR